MDIPNEATKLTGEGTGLPSTIKELPQETEAPEAIPYVISFARYNEDMCQISLLDSNKGRKAVDILKKVGTKIHSEADYQRNFIDRIPVRREGEYKKLYNGLGDDIDLKEIKLQQNARIFYFDIEPERKFYVIAITQNHLETDKVRR